MIDVEYLLVGQGLAGSFLGWELQKHGRSFAMIDDANPSAASRIASGIINPVTGRRIVKTWMIDELIACAREAYYEVAERIGVNCLRETKIIDFFPTPQMRLAFYNRLKEDATYLVPAADEHDHGDHLDYHFGYGVIQPCFLVDVGEVLEGTRRLLSEGEHLREEVFSSTFLDVRPDGCYYKDIRADKVIFCDGISGAGNPWFRNLPFAPNKGEVLIIQANGLPRTEILKKGISIVPWKDDFFWVGSSHEWKYETEGPSDAFRERTLAQLGQFLKVPFTIIDHLSAVRPATLERRPFVGMHPAHPRIGIFNGMGTKGCSLAPFFARHLVEHLTFDTALLPEVDVARFRKVLARAV